MTSAERLLFDLGYKDNDPFDFNSSAGHPFGGADLEIGGPGFDISDNSMQVPALPAFGDMKGFDVSG